MVLCACAYTETEILCCGDYPLPFPRYLLHVFALLALNTTISLRYGSVQFILFARFPHTWDPETQSTRCAPTSSVANS